MRIVSAAAQIALYKPALPDNVSATNKTMRSKLTSVAALAALAAFAIGCAGPEKKLGRGINNFTELARMGELRRTMEQSALWDGPDVAYTTGFIKGLNRTMFRTAVGAFEIATFPIPSYEPYLKPGNTLMPDATINPTYPDNYAPRLISDSTYEPDAALGFTGGDIAPFFPASRFRIYDY